MLRSRLLACAATVALGLAACQYVAELDEDRTVEEGEADGGGAAAGGASNGGAGGGSAGDGQAGSPIGSGGETSGPPKCRIEAHRQASHSSSGNPALAFAGSRWGLGREFFANGVAYSNLDEHGYLQGEEDVQLIPAEPGWSSDNVALVPFKGDFLLGVSRRNNDLQENVPTVVRVSPEDGAVLQTAEAPSFTGPWNFEVASMAVATQMAQSTTLMVMRPSGVEATAELRRFDNQLDSFGEATIPQTWDAAAAWSEELDRFGVFVLKKATPKQIWLHSYPTDGDLDTPIQTRIDQGEEVPALNSLAPYAISATASPQHFFLAWTDERVVNEPRVYLTRVDQDGTRPEDGPAAVWVSESHPDKPQTSPMIVYDGQNLAVTWRSEPHIYFRRFTTSLEPLGDEYQVSSTLSDVQDRPALAVSGPNSYGIAYADSDGADYFLFHRVICDGP